jgi:hypothetical protein
MRTQVQQQITTHFLSAKPNEADTARPTWQCSFDSSTIWGRAVADTSDPPYVAPGAIPWLLVQVVGSRPGPSGGAHLTRTSYLHRVNTPGGVAPPEGCGESAYGRVALVPYSTDYYCYEAAR